MKKLFLSALAALMLAGGMAWAGGIVGDGSNSQWVPYHYGVGGG